MHRKFIKSRLFVKGFLAYGQTTRHFLFACSERIMYLVLALLKVAFVNFTLNEYMMMMIDRVRHDTPRT